MNTEVISVTLDQIKTLTEIIAILLAGVWAVYGYFIFRQRDKSQLELKQIEIETKRSEYEIRQTAIICTNIIHEAIWLHNQQATCLVIYVQINNQGRKDTRIRWAGELPAISIRKVSYNDDGFPMYSENPILLTVRSTKYPNKQAIAHIVRAGGSQTVSFTTTIKDAGVYLITFRGVMAPDEKNVSVEAGASVSSGLSWTATKYIFISGTEDSAQTNG